MEKRMGRVAANFVVLAAVAGGWVCGSGIAHAASIGVSPTLIELVAGESVAGLRVRNAGDEQAVSVQARVVRWHQVRAGSEAEEDVFEPAQDVVASPPVARIAPGAENLIRIVRTRQDAVAGEESYRLLIDELPEPGAQRAGVVSILIRHSVPVFFAQARASAAQPIWRIERAVDATAPGWHVVVQNQGDKRLRLVNLELYDAAGKHIARREGLVGYVLGRSERRFFVAAQGSNTHAALRVTAQNETETLDTGLLPVAAP